MLLAIAWSPFLSAETDPEYNEKLTMLRARLAAEGFETAYLDRLFADERVVLYPEIVVRTGTGFDYLNRRFGLLTESSVERGRNLLRQNRELFDDIEKQFGVSREIVISILRIETNLGRNTGTQRIFNSLLTFAVVENRRSAWARDELVHLLRLARQNNLDPLDMRGSWAGAFGLAQFIPSSYVRFGVDGNGDGVVDLFDFEDAATSIANYLKAHGWDGRRGEKNRAAVWSYNHCDSYVKAVFTYAAALLQPLAKGADGQLLGLAATIGAGVAPPRTSPRSLPLNKRMIRKNRKSHSRLAATIGAGVAPLREQVRGASPS
jgi:membrane-bound lytic murein transglycosylase B